MSVMQELPYRSPSIHQFYVRFHTILYVHPHQRTEVFSKLKKKRDHDQTCVTLGRKQKVRLTV